MCGSSGAVGLPDYWQDGWVTGLPVKDGFIAVSMWVRFPPAPPTAVQEALEPTHRSPLSDGQSSILLPKSMIVMLKRIRRTVLHHETLGRKMICPKCGSQPLTDQKFCRSCGASLQMTTQPLGEPATVSKLERRSAKSLESDEQRGKGLVRWGLIIMLIGVAIGLLGKKLLHQDIVTVVGVLISLAGMFLAVYPYLSPSRSLKYVTPPHSTPKGLMPQQPSKYLPQGRDAEYVPSITERTTDLLRNPAPTKNGRKAEEKARQLRLTY